MGMIKIEMSGSFPERSFSACAEEGGHVCAVKRAIEFLAAQLGPAVIGDVDLTLDGEKPPAAPLGLDKSALVGGLR